jgi:formate dehydrogenase major subunit
MMLTTGRQLFHYNVGTMTRRTDIVKLDQAKEETLRIHPQGRAPAGDRSTASVVDVVSRRGSVRVRPSSRRPRTGAPSS